MEEKFDYLSKLPTEVRRRLKALEYFEGQHAEIDQKFREELMALEKKYFNLRKPLYGKRSEIIKGVREPADDEIILEDEDEDEDRVEEVDSSKPKVKGIPDFWFHVLKNHPVISDMITDSDEPLVKKLNDVEITYLDDCVAYRIDFKFSPNDYFSNEVLSKTYYLQSSDADDIIYDRAEGTPIEWKEGKNLCMKVVTKTQRKRGTNATRTVRKTEPCESFFNFFTPPQYPEADDEITDEQAEELEARMEADFEMGEIFKTKIVAHALDWFTGDALEMEENFDDFEDEDDHEHSDGCGCDDEEGEEDSDEDEGDASNASSKNQKPECKQQ